MGRSQVRLQTESKTNRRFVAIRNERNGKTSYPKVYLRTKNEEVARRRLIALDGVDRHLRVRGHVRHPVPRPWIAGDHDLVCAVPNVCRFDGAGRAGAPPGHRDTDEKAVFEDIL